MTGFELFWFWGCFGIISELLFTALRKLLVKSTFSKEEWALIGHTSIWMFPVYAFGLSYGFDFIAWLIENDVIRTLSYPFWIWGVEIAITKLTNRFGFVLWSYEYLPKWAHWKGTISFVHFPVWILFGFVVDMMK